MMIDFGAIPRATIAEWQRKLMSGLLTASDIQQRVLQTPSFITSEGIAAGSIAAGAAAAAAGAAAGGAVGASAGASAAGGLRGSNPFLVDCGQDDYVDAMLYALSALPEKPVELWWQREAREKKAAEETRVKLRQEVRAMTLGLIPFHEDENARVIPKPEPVVIPAPEEKIIAPLVINRLPSLSSMQPVRFDTVKITGGMRVARCPRCESRHFIPVKHTNVRCGCGLDGEV